MAATSTCTTRAVSLAEVSAAGRLRVLVEEVAASGEEVIVEVEGKPTAVIVPIAEYHELVELRRRDERRRDDALARLRATRARVRSRNQDLNLTDLSDEDVEALTSRAVHEVIDEMASEGTLHFGRDTST